MSWHYVAFAKQKNQKPVVLKIGCDEKVSQDEYRALHYFDGQGAIRLLDYDADNSALLQEQATPGDLLISKHKDIENTIRIYTDTVNTLLHRLEIPSGFTHVSYWCKAIDRISDERINKEYIELANQLRSFLLSTAQNERVCHGDLHCENIIHHQNQWIVIDPKGIIGEVAFEAAAFDLLSNDELKNNDDLSELIFSRTKLLSDELHIEQTRLLYWIFLRTVISAQWFAEDGGDPGKMLLIAKHSYSLIKNLFGENPQ
ncbi:MAG: aminoglycoside phosphotransferase [Gammaproteobacteria bacterium CG_4_10_14_0_8_um_filter_38_16]|nr:MAG: aminoglycoside phosphotransferase [Gammaproteobacteria bacterium CG_4_10_14_0_8_um_filter_38_16]PJA04296.1 MAG: aminoglycoside phosphotransferase [Gammaproteobacteria bacterium CG_4_10_14_0_2_um_filter_38_22]PJB11557.1 MAG: aminoglycoside phosphotransferase [Gammaproteobacteria bacterium CG_4_9_14_3_um_filter_38_9]